MKTASVFATAPATIYHLKLIKIERKFAGGVVIMKTHEMKVKSSVV